jgi:uncharacterized protein (TIGR00290 family)
MKQSPLNFPATGKERIGMEKVLVAWSGGKDSALALHKIQKEGLEIAALLTTVTEEYDRISMHGVRRTLLERQSRALGLPLEMVFIPPETSNEIYEARMAAALAKYAKQCVTTVVFGDLFLEDIRAYREKQLSKTDLKACFPLWGNNSLELAREFIKLGFKAIITCVDSNALDGSFAGRPFDEAFLSALPASVDPCGENGEFHSFVYNGPNFAEQILFTVGKTVVRDNRFHFCDLIPL